MFQIVEVVAVDPTELVGAGVQYAWSDGAPTLRKIKEALETSRGQANSGDVFRQAVEGAVNKGLIALADLGVKALPAAARLLRDEHQKALAKSTGSTRQVSHISVSTLLAGRQIKDVTDLGQALKVVEDAAQRALDKGHIVELM